MAKSKKERGTLSNIGQDMYDFLQECKDAVFEDKERGLDKATEYLIAKLVDATPVAESKHYADGHKSAKESWIAYVGDEPLENTASFEFDKRHYKAVRYIGNSATATSGKNRNIPVVNLLEFSKNGKPFVRATWEAEKNNVFNIIKKEIGNGKTN